MSIKTTVLDDLTQEEGAETFRFTAGGKVYEIDLVPANIDKFWTALKRFTNAARDVTPAPRNPAVDPYAGLDIAVIREWAKAEGIEVNDKGRLPLDLVYRYKRATAVDEPEDEPAEQSQPELQAV